MKLRRRHIIEARADKTFQKCLAIVILLKKRCKTSRIHKYSLNKISKAAGISHRTAEKYEKWLLEYGLAHFEGNKKNKVLVINSISSHTTNRNIQIEEIDCSSFFLAYRSLQSFIFMRLQHNKDFMKHLLQARHDPESPEQYRKAKRKVKNLVKQGKLDSVDVEYREFGLSLKRIAKEVGCCIRTVQKVVDFAIEYGWVTKQHNYEWFYAPNVNRMEIDGYTFSTKNALCIVYPNTYTLDPSISKAFAVGMVSI